MIAALRLVSMLMVDQMLAGTIAAVQLTMIALVATGFLTMAFSVDLSVASGPGGAHRQAACWSSSGRH